MFQRGLRAGTEVERTDAEKEHLGFSFSPLPRPSMTSPPLALSPSSQLRFPLALPRVSLAPCL